MKNSLLKLKANIRNKNSIYSFLSKQITNNRSLNYFEPTDREEEIEDVKKWLNYSKPRFLSIYFTNEWNPICQQYNHLYTKNFTSKSNSFTNLKVDVDIYPRLKWYFDSKHEPGFHFYFYGCLISKIGGCNFEKALAETRRIQEYIDSNTELLNYNASNITYEQPYFNFEDRLTTTGAHRSSDPYQQNSTAMWLNQATFKTFAFEDGLVHQRHKK